MLVKVAPGSYPGMSLTDCKVYELINQEEIHFSINFILMINNSNNVAVSPQLSCRDAFIAK